MNFIQIVLINYLEFLRFPNEIINYVLIERGKFYHKIGKFNESENKYLNALDIAM